MDVGNLTDLIKHAPMFAQLIGLIAAWASMRRATQHNKAQDFLIWLKENNQQELKDLLESNKEAVKGIQTLLDENHEVLLVKLKGIDELLAQIASRIEGFGAIVQAVRPAELPDQAISILQQLDRSGKGGFRQDYHNLFYLDSRDDIKATDLRFLQDDLDTLVKLSLLRRDDTKEGPIFHLTRNGSKYVSMLDS